MKFVFIIQGEGRGHQTQAMAMLDLLKRYGHEVCLALIGSKDGRSVPSMIAENFHAPVAMFKSPALIYSKKSKALSVSKTILNTVPNFFSYLQSLRTINKKIEEVKPDAIINFYDVLGGIYNWLYRPDARFYGVGHQYLLLNKHFIHPDSLFIDRFLVNTNTRLTCLGAYKKLALSFSAFPDDEEQHIVTVTPLLRPELKNLKRKTEDRGFILIYLTQQSMSDEVITWSKEHPETEVHCFTDRKQEKEVVQINNRLYFHRINSRKFLEMMTKCRGLITTAGFESVCEAMTLSKPVMMIPVRKHYEQLCNASDARRAGAGIWRKELEIGTFISYLDGLSPEKNTFNRWFSRNELKILKEMDALHLDETEFAF
jgi:uncharacterized protein (TIGR00661 family)